jgi:hypothetical protein
MEPGDFDEGAFFKAVERCGARALLIGRRALVVLGLPCGCSLPSLDDLILTKQFGGRPRDL